TVRQPAERGKPRAELGERNTGRRGERAGRERVGDVMAAMNEKIFFGKEFSVSARERAVQHAEVLLPGRRVEPEGDDAAPRQAHRGRARIVAVEDLLATAEEDARLGAAVVADSGVAVEMVLGEVEHRRRVRLERPGGFELVARELENPDRGYAIFLFSLQKGIQNRRADVASHLAVDAAAAQQVAGER